MLLAVPLSERVLDDKGLRRVVLFYVILKDRIQKIRARSKGQSIFLLFVCGLVIIVVLLRSLNKKSFNPHLLSVLF